MSATQIYEIQLKGEALKSYPVCNIKTKLPGSIILLNRFNTPILTFNPADIVVFRKVGDVVRHRGDTGKPRTALTPELKAKVIAFNCQGMVCGEIVQRVGICKNSVLKIIQEHKAGAQNADKC